MTKFKKGVSDSEQHPRTFQAPRLERASRLCKHNRKTASLAIFLMLHCRRTPGDNRCVQRKPSSRSDGNQPRDSFLPGALVIVTLCNPREKFWGMILALAPEGLSLSGAELASFEDRTVMVKDGEPFTPAVVFFPMHRIERVDLDLPDGNLPSLSQRFLSKTGLEPSAALTPSSAPQETSATAASRAPKEHA